VIVRLSWRQLQACRYWATDRHKEYLEASTAHRKVHTVAMPFVAWRALSKIMQDAAFTRRGLARPASLKGEKSGTISAVYTLERHCCWYEAHPAMRGEGMMGYSDDHLAVWRSRIPPNLWQPTPAPFEPMMILVPDFDDSLIVSAESVTWKPADGITLWHATEPSQVEVSPPGLFKDQRDHAGW
jgi:hypothetical protein